MQSFIVFQNSSDMDADTDKDVDATDTPAAGTSSKYQKRRSDRVRKLRNRRWKMILKRRKEKKRSKIGKLIPSSSISRVPVDSVVKVSSQVSDVPHASGSRKRKADRGQPSEEDGRIIRGSLSVAGKEYQVGSLRVCPLEDSVPFQFVPTLGELAELDPEVLEIHFTDPFDPFDEDWPENRRQKIHISVTDQPEFQTLEEVFEKSVPIYTVRKKEISFHSSAPKSHAFFAVRDAWALYERSLRLQDVEDPLPLQVMLPLTLEDLKWTMTDFRFDVVGHCQEIFPGRSPKSLPKEVQRFVDSFIQSVEESRILSINTEGQKRFDKSGRPVVSVSLCNLGGEVLFYSSHFDMDPRLKDMISDVKYVKIGSGLENELRELERVNLPLVGWVESGALFRAFLEPTGSSYGLAKQVGYLRDHCLLEGKVEYQPFNWTWNKTIERTGMMDKRMWPHALQNVRVPFAILIACVFKYAEGKALPPETFAYALLFEAIDLCRFKAAANFQNLEIDPLLNWVSRPQVHSLQDHLVPNSGPTLNFLCRARADYVEKVDRGFDFDLEKIIHLVETDVAVSDLIGVDVPSRMALRYESLASLLAKRCSGCGSSQHESSSCDSGIEPICEYPHDGIKFEVPHSTLCCPVLHKYCAVCYTHGHLPFVHLVSEHQKTQLELRERFFRFMHRGLFTRIPFLSLGEENTVCGQFWRGGYLNQVFRRDQITRYQLQVSHTVDVGGDEMVNWRRDILRPRQEKCYRNILAKSVEEMKAIPFEENNLLYHEAFKKNRKRSRMSKKQKA